MAKAKSFRGDTIKINTNSYTHESKFQLDTNLCRGSITCIANYLHSKNQIDEKKLFNQAKSDTEKAVVNTTTTTPSSVPQEKPSFMRSWSFKRFTPRGKRTASLPVTPVGHLDHEPALGSSRGSLDMEAKARKHVLITFSP